ncbi:MAG: 50S ribosome-binding GTPase [Firmicutes bacterium]|nr:50S ribosome-binding GTPase [Bacillota bacterium]
MNPDYRKIENDIITNPDLTESEKRKFITTLIKHQHTKANILITGATGCGKSSTINAMFDMEKAKVGVGVDPETMDISQFKLGNLTLWDSPGLGDGKDKDRQHSKNITDLLHKKDENGDLLIDVVLVLLDGSTKDLGTSYELINTVIIPNLHDPKRLLIGINKADAMLNNRHWDSENSKPLPKLQDTINEKIDSVSQRIFESTGVKVEPVAYSAGFKEEGLPQEKPYNLAKLLHYLIAKIPNEKRAVVLTQSNNNRKMWESNDGLLDYLGQAAVGAVMYGLAGLVIGAETIINGVFDFVDGIFDLF